MLKWPNDLLLGGAKLAGILLERSGERVVAGFGVNLASAPEFPDRASAALGGTMLPQAFAPLLAASFARQLQRWRDVNIATLIQAWEGRAHPKGTALSVHISAEQTIAGNFAGLEPDGALRLLCQDGSVEIVRAADVDVT